MKNQNVKVLYVEDDDDIRAITELVLEGEGFDLVSCSSGQMALELGENLQPDLLLLDVMMPGLDGPTTLRKLREFSQMKNTPVIFMTAKVQPLEVDQYKSLGVTGVISKPFDPMALADQLRVLLPL